ncbi:MAG: ATP-binding cassette domain-containing protein [Spirochaetes bacterium]|nr:ATP-binding cassette domain-containing protein [Spirochaetota bacterium]
MSEVKKQNDYILEMKNVTKQFPGVTALENVSFKVRRGEIHGLCGENGAGKSTLMKILSGYHPFGSYSGTVIYDGEEIRFKSKAIGEAISKGIAIVYQELALVPCMTAGENIYLGREPVGNGNINWHQLYSNANKILNKYKLNIKSTDKVSDLAVGKQQMVEIAKALSENARLLILDEPTSALTELEIDKLMEILETLKEHGVTCIYISHKMDEFFRITDTLTIMRDGKVIETQPTKGYNNDKIVSQMVGREMTERFPVNTRKSGNILFEVRHLTAKSPFDSKKEILSNVTFNVCKGEIFGIAGLMGSGRTELVTTLFGEHGTITDGDIILDGEQIEIHSARDAMTKGMSLVPEDRKKQGLILLQSIKDNIALANMDKFSSFMNINKHKEYAECHRFSQNLKVKAPSINVSVHSLSGGNQQKVVISKWMMTQPKLLILDDPTRGIDVGAKYEIYKLMNELAGQGVAIIMISSELEEVLGMSDRVMVMCEGSSSEILDIKNATQEKIMKLATGC